jgi:hypothetical protein
MIRMSACCWGFVVLLVLVIVGGLLLELERRRL